MLEDTLLIMRRSCSRRWSSPGSVPDQSACSAGKNIKLTAGFLTFQLSPVSLQVFCRLRIFHFQTLQRIHQGG